MLLRRFSLRGLLAAVAVASVAGLGVGPAAAAPSDRPKPAAAPTPGRTFDPVRLTSLGRCLPTTLQWGVDLSLVDRKTGRQLDEAEVVAERVSAQLVVDGKPLDAPRRGNAFELRWRTPDTAGAHTVFVRLVTPSGNVDGPPQETFLAPDARVQLLSQIPIPEVAGGCAKDARCVPLDLGKSIALWAGLPLEITRKKPTSVDGWPDAALHLKKGAELIELVRDKPVTLPHAPTESWQVCYAAPRCVSLPDNPQEMIAVRPIHVCLDEKDDACAKDPKGFGCGQPRAATALVVPDVRPNSWLDCNLWWILIVAGVIVLVLVVAGIVTPAQFSASAMLRVANSDRQLGREQGRPLRREPGGKRGFYRTATVCFTDIGTTVLKSKGHVLMLKAGPDKQILIVKKGANLERWERNAWRQVDPTNPGKDILPERSLVSGGKYRVNGQYFFVVDF